ncbi:MAG: hypothetical protein KY432_03010, partial [Acidobacteria bacterium]|nr:hypothetical protein [Acidobacteriota bacterium]
MPRLLLVVSLVVSVSLGATEIWTHTGPPGGIVTAVAFHPTDDTVAWIGTPGGVHKSTDGGATWSLLTSSPGGVTVTGIAIHPNDPAVIYIATSSRGVWKTTDGGATWSHKSSGLESSYFEPYTYRTLKDIAIDSADPMTLYAATAYGSIVKSTDAGESWVVLELPSDLRNHQETIAIDPKSSDIYVGAERGLYRSTDGGATWSAATNFPASNYGWPNIEDIDFDTSTTPSTIWVASMGGGVTKSTDSGASWTRVGGSLITYAYSVARAPGGGSTLYVGGYN